MKILLSIPNELLHQLDVYCESNGYTRSEFIRMCIRSELSPSGGISLTAGYPDEKYIPKVKPLVIKEAFKVTEPTVEKFVEAKQIKLCKHGAAIGNCKHGCTK